MHRQVFVAPSPSVRKMRMPKAIIDKVDLCYGLWAKCSKTHEREDYFFLTDAQKFTSYMNILIQKVFFFTVTDDESHACKSISL